MFFYSPLLQQVAISSLAPLTATIAVTLDSFGVDIEAVDPDTTSVSLTLADFGVSLSVSSSDDGSVSMVLGTFVIDIEAADPDSSSISLTPGTFSFASQANSRVTAAVASFLSPFGVDIEAADPDSTAIPLVLSEFGVDIELSTLVVGASGIVLAPFSIDIEAIQLGSSSIGLRLQDFTADIEASSVDDATIGFFLDGFDLSVTAAVTVPESSVIVLRLGAFDFYSDSETSVELDSDMTISQIIPALLNPLVDGRVWQDATPDDLPRSSNGLFQPFIIWNTLGGQDSEYVEQYPPPAFGNIRLQIHPCAPSAIAVDRLMRRVCSVLLASPYTLSVLGSPVGTYDAERKLRGRRQLFSIWFRQ